MVVEVVIVVIGGGGGGGEKEGEEGKLKQKSGQGLRQKIFSIILSF